MKSVVGYKKAVRQDAGRLPSGPNAKFWIYKDVEIHDPDGSKHKFLLFVFFFDPRDAYDVVTGKALLCKGKCGLDSGKSVLFLMRPYRTRAPLKNWIGQLVGKAVQFGHDLPDYSGLDIDKLKKLVIDQWSGGPGNLLVKVVSTERGPVSRVRGYVTQEKFIRGKGCEQLERLLGLPAGELKNGAHVLRLARLPKPAEFELRGYTQTPEGKPYSGGVYPSGSGAPQWNLVVDLPVTPIKFISRGERY